ncbi:uncharacterized protein LOC143235230 [Tachypleus tridentatus]
MISENVYVCDLSAIQMCMNVFVGLGFTQRVQNNCNKRTTIRVEISERAPKIKRAKMNENVRKVVVETDKILKYNTMSCSKLFSNQTVSEYDLKDQDCMIRQNEIHINIAVHVDLHPHSLLFTLGEENQLSSLCFYNLGDQMNGSFTVMRNKIPLTFEILALDSFCCNTVELKIGNVIGDGGAGVNFTWSVTKEPSGTDDFFLLKKEFYLLNKRSVRVPIILFRPNESYIFTVRGVSQAGLEFIRNKTVLITRTNLTATIFGPEKLDSLIDNVFTAHIDMDEQWAAKGQSLSFMWTILPPDVVLPSEWGSTLVIPRYLMEADKTYSLHLRVCDRNNSRLWTRTSKQLITLKAPLLARVKWDTMIIPFGTKFCVDGSSSRDLGNHQGSLGYR